MTKVATKGSWVMMIVNTSAGSSGARRAHSAARFGPRCAEVASGRSRVWVAMSLALVLGRDLLGQCLSRRQRGVHSGRSGYRGADLLRHLGAQVGELGDVDELDAQRRPRLHARVLRVGAADGVLGLLGERTGFLDVVRVAVGRGPLARRHPGPAQLLADQVLVVLSGRPRDELPGVVLLR